MSSEIPSTGQTRTIDRDLMVESVVVLAASAALYWATYTFDTVPSLLAQGIQPTAYPRAVLILTFGLGLIQLIGALRVAPVAVAGLRRHKPVAKIVYLTALALVVFAILLPIVGTYPALAIFCPALAMLWGERRWKMMAASFGGFIVFIYLLFSITMHVPLP